MNKRFNLKEIQPKAHLALRGLEIYLESTSIQPLTKELIKIRASQINGCAFCLDLHTRDARKLGETEQRIYLLNAWRETDIYSEEEKIVLALTEEITLIHQHGLSDEVYDKAIMLFGEEKTAQLIMAVININAWNRAGISLRKMPVTDISSKGV